MTRSTPPLGALACWIFLFGPLGCASSPDDPPDLGKATVAFARVVKSGAGAVGRGMGTAYRGVRSGIEAPAADADFGPYPSGYVTLVKQYFVLALRYPEETSFRLGKPERGYLHQGLLRGGGIAWQGWLVEVEVETRQRLTGHRARRSYVARLRDGEVVDVHTDDPMLRRVERREEARAERQERP